MADTLDLGFGASADAGNPYLQNIIDLSSRDLVDNYNRVVTPAQNAAAVRSGSFGNSALGELAQADQKNLQTSLGDLSSKLRFNDYTSARDFNEGQRQFDLGYGRSLFNDAYGQNMGNLQAGLGIIGALQGFNANDITGATNQQNTPLQYWQQFMNGANAIGQGYGTTTGVQGTTSNPVGAALGGAQLGSSLYSYGQNNGWWGNNSGNTTGITGTSGQSGVNAYGAPPSGSYLQ